MNTPPRRPIVTDAQLRMMRDAIFPATLPETRQTEESWEHVKAHWRADEEWLTQEFFKVKTYAKDS